MPSVSLSAPFTDLGFSRPQMTDVFPSLKANLKYNFELSSITRLFTISQCQCRSVYLITFFLLVLKFNKRSISPIKQDDKWTITEVILIAPRVDENFPWKLDFCDTLMDCTHSVDWRSNMLFFLSTVEHERVLFFNFWWHWTFFVCGLHVRISRIETELL